MAQQAQQVSEWSQSLRARLHIAAYVSVGIFLYLEGGRLSNVLMRGMGIVFFAPAFLILIGQLPIGILRRIAKSADDIFLFPRYIATIVIVTMGVLNWVSSTKQTEALWAIPVVLLVFIVYDIIGVVKNTRTMVRSIGTKATAIRQLKLLSLVLIVFVLVVLAFDAQGIGKPVFWLIPAVVSLIIALFLDGTLKK